MNLKTCDVMEIIIRVAEDKYDAVTVAQAMEDAGANVFSIIKSDEDSPKFSVYAKYLHPITPEDIDREIKYLQEKLNNNESNQS